jgi:hypothetical protein
MNVKLLNYFNGLAKLISEDAKLSGFSSENADIGKSREYLCNKLLVDHLPSRLSVLAGGNIFDSSGNESGQLDIIITHDMSLNFRHNHIVSCAAESVSAVIGVKSILNKKEIESSLKNIASVPQLDSSVIQMGSASRPSTEYIGEWPAFFVFAYDGISPTKAYEHICSYLEANPTPLNRIPRAIIVNNKYVIKFVAYDTNNLSTDYNFVRSDMTIYILEPGREGMALFWMMIELSKSITWLDGIYVDYESYYTNTFM